MPNTRETAAQRLAREAQEVSEAHAHWQREKPTRLLRALAWATDLGVDARVYNRGQELSYQFSFGGYEDYSDTVAELSENVMIMIEDEMKFIEHARARDQHLRNVRDQLISTLTEEQKQALGII